jgi:hypothetical protein
MSVVKGRSFLEWDEEGRMGREKRQWLVSKIDRREG